VLIPPGSRIVYLVSALSLSSLLSVYPSLIIVPPLHASPVSRLDSFALSLHRQPPPCSAMPPLAPVSSSANICKSASPYQTNRGIQFVGLNGGFHRRLSSETGGFQEAAYIHTLSPDLVEQYLGARICRYRFPLFSWGGYAARGRPEVADMQQVHDRLVISKTLYGAVHAVLRHRPPRGPKLDMIFDNRSREETSGVWDAAAAETRSSRKARNAAR
jgi:hypothetical protein